MGVSALQMQSPATHLGHSIPDNGPLFSPTTHPVCGGVQWGQEPSTPPLCLDPWEALWGARLPPAPSPA